MIRCVRLFTGADQQSHIEIGRLDLTPGRNDDLVSAAMSSIHVTAEETATGGTLAWHTAPVRQLVVTLAGTLVFTTRDAEEFTLAPGDVLLAEDTVGSGPPVASGGRRPVAADLHRARRRRRRPLRRGLLVAGDDIGLVDGDRLLGARQQ